MNLIRHAYPTSTDPRSDVLEPRPALLQRLRLRLHIQEPTKQGGGLRYALRGQVSQELRAPW